MKSESLRLLYDSDGMPRVVEGNDLGLSGTLSLGPPFVQSKEQEQRSEMPSAASVMNPEGGGVSAWPSADRQGHPAVAVREDFPNGAVQTALVERRRPAVRSANWPSDALGWATGSWPSSRDRSAMRRSSPRR